MAKDCPFCSSDPDRPAVDMKPLRALVLMVWRMELAQKGLLDDGYDPIRDPLAEPPDSEIPLDGLQVKLVDINLHVKRISKFLDEMLAYDNWHNDPLYLLRHSQILTDPLDK